ncbi:MAG: hypothetical protein V4615_03545 [Bacteroidota bacterium]
MARRTVKIEIPIGYPEKYTHLIQRIWGKHVELGPSSPFFNNPMIDMSKFEANMQQALELREQAIEHHEKGEVLMQQSRQLLGVDKGQTINTPDTLYYFTDIIKRILRVKHIGIEEMLSSWGFNVIIRQAKNPVRKKKAAASGQ